MGAKPFDDHDLRLLQTLANQVAVAIDNARLFAAVQASEATIVLR
jgi:GAF domain-containing protein